MKWIPQWLTGRTVEADDPSQTDAAYHRTMRLADEVSDKIRERAGSQSPFRAALSEMLLGKRPDDPVLIADAFEVAQESRIFRGPPNGSG